jgi:biotin operon repressor
MSAHSTRNGAKVNGHNGAHAPIGHNGGEPLEVAVADALRALSFDDAARDALSSGLILSQRDALIRCIRDPMLSQRSKVVLAEIVLLTNNATGAAFPGRRLLAERTGYTEPGIAKALQELRLYGYVVDCKRAGPNGGRALMHYVVVKPTLAEMQFAIAAHIEALRTPRGMADVPYGGFVADVPSGGYIRADVPSGGFLRHKADVPPLGSFSGADVPPVGRTVTRSKELEVSEVSIGGAVAPSGASAPSPTIDEQVISSAEELARHHEAVAVAEIIDAEVEVLEPVEAGQGFGSAKPKAKRANGSGAKTDRSSHKDRGTLWNPDNFDLEKIQAYAASQGLTPDETRIVWKRLKNWTEAKQYRYIDWNAAFRKQVDDDINDGRVGPNKRKHGRGNGRMSIDEIAEAATQTAAAAPKFKMT